MIGSKRELTVVNFNGYIPHHTMLGLFGFVRLALQDSRVLQPERKKKKLIVYGL